MRDWTLAVRLVIGAACALSLPVFAATVAPRPFSDLASSSPVVVHGRVVQIEVDSESGRRTAVVEALEIVRSPEKLRTERDFRVPLLNRSIPRSELVEWVPGAPELRDGEETLLFLRPLGTDDRGGRALYALDGFHQGKFRVVEDSHGVRRVLAWDQLAEASVEPANLKHAKTSLRRGLRSLRTPRLAADEERRLGLPASSRAPTLVEALDRVRAGGGGR
jgi:hypothetical protein